MKIINGVVTRIGVVTILFTVAVPAWADGPGKRETLALQACLADHSEAEHMCFDVPYYTCMGEQLSVAANPRLATERCLFQEQFVWGALMIQACDALALLSEQKTTGFLTDCSDVGRPNWIGLTNEIAQPTYDLGFSDLSLRLVAQRIRSHAVQLRMVLAAYRNDG